jgi:hypothetical protein
MCRANPKSANFKLGNQGSKSAAEPRLGSKNRESGESQEAAGNNAMS